MKSSQMTPPPLPKQGQNRSTLEGWYHQQVGQCRFTQHSPFTALMTWLKCDG